MTGMGLAILVIFLNRLDAVYICIILMALFRTFYIFTVWTFPCVHDELGQAGEH